MTDTPKATSPTLPIPDAAHSDLSAAAYWKWREGYRAHVPALQTRAG